MRRHTIKVYFDSSLLIAKVELRIYQQQRLE
jgi:hypothetical protein